MPIILTPEDRAEWLTLRQQDVTASAVGALLGCHPYLTALDLYAENSGRLPQREDDPSGAMLRGQLLESVGVEMLRRERPDWTVIPNAIGNGGAYYRDPDLRMGATPDTFIVDEEGRKGVVQIKSVEPGVFRREWLADGNELLPPAWIVCQVITEAVLTGSELAYIVPIRVGYAIDIDLLEVPVRMDIFDRIKREAAEFWCRVADGSPPDPDYHRDGKLLAQLLGPDDGSTISLAGDNAFCEAIGRRETLKAQIKQAEEELSYCEALIKDRMGSAAIAKTATHIVSHKSYHRKAYSIAYEAKDVRTLRIREIHAR